MIKLFYHKNYFNNWSSELILLYQDLIKYHEILDDRFNILKTAKQYFEFVDNINECDFVVLPYKWRGKDKNTIEILNDCKLHHKKILVFFNDDNSKNIDIDENDGLIFRTSFFKSSKKPNEYSLPCFIDDYFNNKIIEKTDIKKTVGFCGLDHFQRKKVLSILKNNSEIITNFIVRKSFWAGEIKRDLAIKDFISNIENNLFTFCCRGAGNFSYRFYEVLSMGRIPLVLDTDMVLPFEDLVDYNQNCVIVSNDDIDSFDEKFLHYFNNTTIDELYEKQLNNRLFYLNNLSPEGFLKNLNLLLLNHETK